jgi:Putative metallopeptidase
MRLFPFTKIVRPVAYAAAAFAFGTLSATSFAASQTGTGGKLLVVYEAGADAAWDEYAKKQQAKPVFEEMAAAISDSIHLPNDLTTRFRNCGEANAFYSPQTNEIIMCYELIATVHRNFSAAGGEEEEIEAEVMGATLFFFLHELGHALVSQLDLPITGREEDAVDDLASIIMLAADEDDGDDSTEEGYGALMLSSAAIQFGDMAAQPEAFENIIFWGEHSLDAQRMYHLLCMIYGSNPAAYTAMVGDDALPKARADQCPTEFQQRQRNWNRLLEAHFKPES